MFAESQPCGFGLSGLGSAQVQSLWALPGLVGSEEQVTIQTIQAMWGAFIIPSLVLKTVV